jgi:hypothetical protein
LDDSVSRLYESYGDEEARAKKVKEQAVAAEEGPHADMIEGVIVCDGS